MSEELGVWERVARARHRVCDWPSAPVGASTFGAGGKRRPAAGELAGHPPPRKTAHGRVQTLGATVATSGSHDSGAGSRAPAAGLGECPGASGPGGEGPGPLAEAWGGGEGCGGRASAARSASQAQGQGGQFILGLVLFAVFGPGPGAGVPQNHRTPHPRRASSRGGVAGSHPSATPLGRR